MVISAILLSAFLSKSQNFQILAEILIVPIVVLITFILSFIFNYLRKNKNKKNILQVKKINRVNWIKLYELYNNNKFKIIDINLERQFIEYSLLKEILITNQLEKIIINNLVTIVLNQDIIKINYAKLFLDKKTKCLQITQKIFFNRKILDLEIKEIFKGIENNIEINFNTEKSTEIINTITLCKKEQIIKFSKNFKKAGLLPYNSYINQYIFGLHLQEKYSRKNYIDHYKKIILNDISIIQKLFVN